MKTAIVALVGMLMLGCRTEPGAKVVNKTLFNLEGNNLVSLTLEDGRVCTLDDRGAQSVDIGDRIIDTSDGYVCQDGKGWR